MPSGVKSSPPRREQARTRLARAAVVEAARALFAERGYAATTLEAISAAAGVPQATVYRLFCSKIGVLKTVLDVAAVGDDEPVAFGDRPDVRAALALEDPAELITFFADLSRHVMARLAPVHQILVGASATDPQAAALLAAHIAQCQRGQSRVAEALARRGALREGVSKRTAADIIHALMSPEMYRLLTLDRGWSPQAYSSWLAQTLRQQLLG